MSHEHFLPDPLIINHEHRTTGHSILGYIRRIVKCYEIDKSINDDVVKLNNRCGCIHSQEYWGEVE
jgi:hypothetical protein